MLSFNYLRKSFFQPIRPTPRVLICPDKFKFSLTSAQVSSIIRDSLPAGTQNQILTLADGGEGSLETISTKVQGTWQSCLVSDPLFRKIQAKYFFTADGEAYIEMARASGLGLLADSERSILQTTTYGTGQLILDSLRRNNTRVNLLIGGSATNDGGIGCAEALGYRFYDKQLERLRPVGSSLINIASIKHEEKEKMDLLQKAKFSVYTDVTNPLTGPNGASYIYGPQKGATAEEVELLDRGLTNLNRIFKQDFGIDADLVPGSGAAGGLGAGCLVLLKTQLLKGIDLIFRVTDFQRALNWADLVITGEGKFDGQTLEGKVVKGVIDRCSSENKPVIVLCAIADQVGDISSAYPNVKVIEILNDEQKKVIDPQTTKKKLRQAVWGLLR